jgi:hypothetical protein
MMEDTIDGVADMRPANDSGRTEDRSPALMVGFIGLVLLLAACNGGGDAVTEDLVTTSSTSGQVNTSAPVSTSSTTPASTTTTTAPSTTSTSSVSVASQVIVTIDGVGLHVEPDDVVQGPAEGIQVLVVNDTNEPQQVVFVSIFAGSPDDLPVVDGLVDVSRCNQIFGDEGDDDPSPATFGCFGHLGEATPVEVVQLDPGETLPLDDGVPPGAHLIIDHRPGGYEQGRYAVFEILDLVAAGESSLAASFEEIVGAYEKPPGEIGYVEISPDGTMLWAGDRNDPDQIRLDASFDGETFVITDPDCGPDSLGRYEIHLVDDGSIDIVLVDDACAGRAGLIQGQYEPLS